jgi:hypothetical protein
VPIAMEDYQEELKLSIAAMPNFDVILGEDWLDRHAASLYYKGTFVAKFEHQGIEYNIPAVMPCRQQNEQQNEQQNVQQIDTFEAFDGFDSIPQNDQHQHSLGDDTAIISAMSFLKIANPSVAEQSFVVRIRQVHELDIVNIASAVQTWCHRSAPMDGFQTQKGHQLPKCACLV